LAAGAELQASRRERNDPFLLQTMFSSGDEKQLGAVTKGSKPFAFSLPLYQNVFYWSSIVALKRKGHHSPDPVNKLLILEWQLFAQKHSVISSDSSA
jgi:hypothetical protein